MTLIKYQRVKQSRGALDAITAGRVIAIDPASGKASNPGYCIMEAGVIMEFGVLQIPKARTINLRLKAILETVRDELPPADILVIEDIPAFFLTRQPSTCKPLLFSCGVIMAAQPWPFVMPIPPIVWHSLLKKIIHPVSKDNYIKCDEHDALMLAVTAYSLATSGRLPKGLDIGRLTK
jgi:hypothetical protein